MERPRLKAHYSAEVVDRGVFLLAEGRHHLLPTGAVEAVLPLLDGTRTVGEIVTDVADRVPVHQALFALRRLERIGVLAEGRPALTDGELAFWEAQDLDPVAVVDARGELDVVVTALGAAAVDGVVRALRDQDLPVRVLDPAAAANALSGPQTVLVAVTDDYLDPGLAALNAAAIAAGSTWVLARPAGTAVWVGPVLRPGVTACWECLAQRVRGNRQVERYLAGKRGEGAVPRQPAKAASAAGDATVGAVLGLELLRSAVTGASPRLDGRLVTLDLAGVRTDDHAVVRQPQCAACGDPRLVSERDPRVELAAADAVHTTDGGFRTAPPHVTLARLSHHISPITGAVTSLTPHDDDDNGITYSFTAGHNFAMVHDNVDLLKRNLRGQSGGKGRSETQARVSAVCEAIERYSGVWRGDEPVVRAATQDLDPLATIHPDRLLGFSEAQLAGAAAWNAEPSHRLHLIPRPLDPATPIDWSRSWSLTHDGERLLPAGYAWFGHPDLDDDLWCVTDSNGGASGNVLAEAILQGFCEIVERDAVALWWYNRCIRPQFDLDSLGDPYVGTLRAFYDDMDRDLWVLDLTTDLEVPTFAAISRRRHDVEDVMLGFGSHLDPKIAVMRALTEVNQFLPFIDRRDANGDTVYRTDDPETLAWCKTATVAAEPWLLPDPATPAKRVEDYRQAEGRDLVAHVDDCVDRAKACGLEVVVLDQTRPDLELAVVKVVVPGMRHFWRRLGPGRLYDVPVTLGWLDQPRTEEEMNPWNVFF